MPAFSSIISQAARKVNRTGKFVIKIYDFFRKKPALLVPLAHASRGDQAQNAAYFARKDLCAVLDEGHLDTLPSALLCLYGNAKIRAALERDHTVSGTQAIADVIRSVIG